jgi:hypothetical protein
MVLMLVEYLHSGRQLLVRGEGVGGPFLRRHEGLRAPFLGDGPPTSTSFLKGSSPERATRSTLRTGPRMGGSHPPQLADASLLPQRLCGTCQWLRCWLSVCTQTPALPVYEPRRLRQGLAVSLELLLREESSLDVLSGRGRGQHVSSGQSPFPRQRFTREPYGAKACTVRSLP